MSDFPEEIPTRSDHPKPGTELAVPRYYASRIAGEPLWPGCDVSLYQNPKEIDWVKAANLDNIRFVMVRCGYGAVPDLHCVEHVKRVRDAGLHVGIYHFPSESPLDAQWETVEQAIRLCDVRIGDIAPAFDLEPLDGIGRLPSDIPTYLQTVDALLDRAFDLVGSAWIYTGPGYYSQMGKPHSWLGWDWWRSQWGAHEPDDEPVPWTIWQKGWITPGWANGKKIDYNLARLLPLTVKS